MKEQVVSVKKQKTSNAPDKPCPGYKLYFPPGQQAYTSYPFALHTVLLLPWDYSGRRDGLFLISHLCSGIVGRSGWCKQCDDLGNSEYLQKIVARFTDGIHENTPAVFHGIGGLIDIVHRKTQSIDTFCLCHLSALNTLEGKKGKIDIQKQLLLAISLQRIPQVDHVLDEGFHHGTGIHGMLKLIKKAADGTYHPKGFDEEEELQALLFLHLGGAQVTDVAHHMFGTPAVSTIQKHTIIPQILALPSFPTSYEIGCNITASFKAICELLGATMQNMLHAMIMFDEILVERCPHWDDKTNKILGVCQEHGQETNLEFTSEEDLQMLWEEM